MALHLYSCFYKIFHIFNYFHVYYTQSSAFLHPFSTCTLMVFVSLRALVSGGRIRSSSIRGTRVMVCAVENVQSFPAQVVVLLASRVNGEGAGCEQTFPDYTQMFLTVTLGVLDKCAAAGKIAKQHQLWKQSGNSYIFIGV